jgi:O-antigen/teichoic acid export membrane protein
VISRLKPKSDFSKNVVTLVTGTTIAQAIPVLISPVLTRLYSPEDFGIYAVYFSLVMIASVVATAKYEMAIVLPKTDDEARRVLSLSVLMSMISSAILLSIILVAYPFIDERMMKEKFILLLLPAGVFLIGLSQSLHYYFNRHGRYKSLVKGRILRSTAYSLSAVLFGLFKPAGAGLVVSDTSGYFANNIFLWFKHKGLLKTSEFRWNELTMVAKRYINFPKYLIVSGFFEKGSGQAPVLFLNNLFSSTAGAGYFSLAQRMIITPADLISRAISDVFREKAGRDFANSGNCRSIFLSTFKKLLFLGVISFGIGYFIIEDLFRIVFGEAWAQAGVYAQIMMPMFFFQFVVSPLSIVFVIAEKQKYDLMMQALLLLMVAASFLVGHFYFGSIKTAIKLFTFVYSVKYLIEFLLAYRFSRGKS